MNKINAPYISSLETLSDEALYQALACLESNSIDCVNWKEFPYKPSVTFRIAHSDKAVAILFEVSEGAVVTFCDRTQYQSGVGLIQGAG